MNNKQVFATLIFGQLFSWIGLHSSHFIVFPFLFGISVPLANWASVKYNKWKSTVALGLISTGLFYGTIAVSIWIADLQVWLSFAVVVVSGLGFLFFNSAFISSIQANVFTGTVTVLLVSVSLPIGQWFWELLEVHGPDQMFLFTTFLTTLGLCSSRLSPN